MRVRFPPGALIFSFETWSNQQYQEASATKDKSATSRFIFFAFFNCSQYVLFLDIVRIEVLILEHQKGKYKTLRMFLLLVNDIVNKIYMKERYNFYER